MTPYGNGSVGVDEVKSHTSGVFDRVARGETVGVIKDGRTVARIVPVRGGSSSGFKNWLLT